MNQILKKKRKKKMTVLALMMRTTIMKKIAKIMSDLKMRMKIARMKRTEITETVVRLGQNRKVSRIICVADGQYVSVLAANAQDSGAAGAGLGALTASETPFQLATPF
jgi:predicted TPR repeat methyltransferase